MPNNRSNLKSKGRDSISKQSQMKDKSGNNSRTKAKSPIEYYFDSDEEEIPKLDFVDPEAEKEEKIRKRSYSSLVDQIRKLEMISWDKLDPTLSQNSPLNIPPFNPKAMWFWLCYQYFPRKFIRYDFESQIDNLYHKLTQIPNPVDIKIFSTHVKRIKTLQNKKKQASIKHQRKHFDFEPLVEEFMKDIEKEFKGTQFNNCQHLSLNIWSLLSQTSQIIENQVKKYDLDHDLFLNEITTFLIRKMEESIPEQYKDTLEDLGYDSKVIDSNFSMLDSVENLQKKINNVKKSKKNTAKNNVLELKTNLLKQVKTVSIDSLMKLYMIEHEQTTKQIQKGMKGMSTKFKKLKKQEKVFLKAVDLQEATCDIHCVFEEEKDFLNLVEIEKCRHKALKIKEKEQELKQSNSKNRNNSKRRNTSSRSQKSIRGGTNLSLNSQRRVNRSIRVSNSTKEIPNELYVCQICNGGDYQDDNLIVFCSRCSVTVHMKCYGISALPDVEWICDLCNNYQQTGKYMKCMFCTRRGGAMRETVYAYNNSLIRKLNPDYAIRKKLGSNKNRKKKSRSNKSSVQKLNAVDYNQELTSRKQSQKRNEEFEKNLFYNYFRQPDDYTKEEIKDEPRPARCWAHLTCVYWIPGVRFEEEEEEVEIIKEKKINSRGGRNKKINSNKSSVSKLSTRKITSDLNTTKMTIEGLEEVDEIRFEIPCQICNSTQGAIAQCVSEECLESFHPECARRQKIKLSYRHLYSPHWRIYCDSHSELLLKKNVLELRDRFSNDIFRFTKAVEKYYNSYGIKDLEEKKFNKGNRRNNRTRKDKNSLRLIYLMDYFIALAKEKEKKGKAFVWKFSLNRNQEYKIDEIVVPDRSRLDLSSCSNEVNIQVPSIDNETSGQDESKSAMSEEEIIVSEDDSENSSEENNLKKSKGGRRKIINCHSSSVQEVSPYTTPSKIRTRRKLKKGKMLKKRNPKNRKQMKKISGGKNSKLKRNKSRSLGNYGSRPSSPKLSTGRPKRKRVFRSTSQERSRSRSVVMTRDEGKKIIKNLIESSALFSLSNLTNEKPNPNLRIIKSTKTSRKVSRMASKKGSLRGSRIQSPKSGIKRSSSKKNSRQNSSAKKGKNKRASGSGKKK